MTNKDEKSYKIKNFFKFFFRDTFIIISEITLRYSGLSINNMIIYFLIPTSLFYDDLYLYNFKQ